MISRRALTATAKTKPDDTRARIMETAEGLFRRLGFAKTTVADIASELKMSPANVYRFFASKNAIVQAICARFLADLDERAWAVARSRGSAASRLEKLFREILTFHTANLLTEKRVYDMVQVAMEDSWEAILAHKEVVRGIVEMILRDGIAAGEFVAVDPNATSRQFMRLMVSYCHPMLVAQCLQDGHDMDAEIGVSVQFLLRAISSRS